MDQYCGPNGERKQNGTNVDLLVQCQAVMCVVIASEKAWADPLLVHGCLLRFTLPRQSEGRSFLVEPIFSKRSDAKSAVALHAISQGVGAWIKSVGDAVENLITPEMRAKAQSLIGPLSTECTRAGIQGQPAYIYAHEDGGT